MFSFLIRPRLYQGWRNLPEAIPTRTLWGLLSAYWVLLSATGSGRNRFGQVCTSMIYVFFFDTTPFICEKYILQKERDNNNNNNDDNNNNNTFLFWYDPVYMPLTTSCARVWRVRCGGRPDRWALCYSYALFIYIYGVYVCILYIYIYYIYIYICINTRFTYICRWPERCGWRDLTCDWRSWACRCGVGGGRAQRDKVAANRAE